jgi:crotonobetainyl-CoA:carnitine CoA-transferase CaiB-like acyl-CoA transferase
MTSLDGIRVLDLSRVLAGPWCTQTLADLGADVIKIERPGTGDDTRTWGPPFLKDKDGSRHARGRVLPGHQPQQALGHLRHRAAGRPGAGARAGAHCDVFVENFKVGDMARYGLDYASIREAINPRIVYCSVTGFGQTGPYRERAGYDYAVQGMGGLMSVTGERDDLGGGPQKVGVAVADLFTGLYAAWPSRRRCGTPSAPARASTSTWRCWTRRWRCWPTWAPTTW